MQKSFQQYSSAPASEFKKITTIKIQCKKNSFLCAGRICRVRITFLHQKTSSFLDPRDFPRNPFRSSFGFGCDGHVEAAGLGGFV